MFFKGNTKPDQHISAFSGLEVDLAQKWAEQMEGHVAIGVPMHRIAVNALEKVDTERVCNYMPELLQSMVQYLTDHWEYGDVISAWWFAQRTHN